MIIYWFNYTWYSKLKSEWWIMNYALYMSILLILNLAVMVLNSSHLDEHLSLFSLIMFTLAINKTIYILLENIGLAKYVSLILILLSITMFSKNINSYPSFFLIILCMYNTLCYECLEKLNA